MKSYLILIFLFVTACSVEPIRPTATDVPLLDAQESMNKYSAYKAIFDDMKEFTVDYDIYQPATREFQSSEFHVVYSKKNDNEVINQKYDELFYQQDTYVYTVAGQSTVCHNEKEVRCTTERGEVSEWSEYFHDILPFMHLEVLNVSYLGKNIVLGRECELFYITSFTPEVIDPNLAVYEYFLKIPEDSTVYLCLDINTGITLQTLVVLNEDSNMIVDNLYYYNATATNFSLMVPDDRFFLPR